MKIKKAIIIFVALFTLLVILISALLLDRLFSASKPEFSSEKITSEKIAIDSKPDQPVSAQYTDGTLFLSAIKQNETEPSSEIISGLIVPHHLLAKDIIAATFAYASQGNYRDIVLLNAYRQRRTSAIIGGIVKNSIIVTRQKCIYSCRA